MAQPCRAFRGRQRRRSRGGGHHAPSRGRTKRASAHNAHRRAAPASDEAAAELRRRGGPGARSSSRLRSRHNSSSGKDVASVDAAAQADDEVDVDAPADEENVDAGPGAVFDAAATKGGGAMQGITGASGAHMQAGAAEQDPALRQTRALTNAGAAAAAPLTRASAAASAANQPLGAPRCAYQPCKRREHASR